MNQDNRSDQLPAVYHRFFVTVKFSGEQKSFQRKQQRLLKRWQIGE